MEAEAKGLNEIFNAANSNPDFAKFYFGVKNDVFTTLGKHSADAVRGMKPKFHFWTTGSDGSSQNKDPFAHLRNIFMGIPPMLSAVQEQTNIKMPFLKDVEPPPNDK